MDTRPGRAATPQGAGRAFDFPKRRILVVDNERDIVDATAMLLEILGQEVQRAYDGPTALRIAEYFEPELVLLDLDMPHMNGVEVARALRTLPALKKTRLIAHTGFGRPEYRPVTIGAGFDGVLRKPIRLADVVDLIHGFDLASDRGR